MFRALCAIFLLLTSVLSGCQTIGSPVSWLSGRFTSPSTDEKQEEEAFELNLSDETKDRQSRMNSRVRVEHYLIKEMIAETPVGAEVSVVVDCDRQYSGMLRSKNANSLELMNCISKETVPGPDGLQQCKTSHVPFHTFPIASLTRFLVIAPPASDFVAPDLSKGTHAVTVAEFVFKDGRHRRLIAPAQCMAKEEN